MNIKSFLSKKDQEQMKSAIERNKNSMVVMPIADKVLALGNAALNLGFKGALIAVEDEEGNVHSQGFGSINVSIAKK